jgi:outer membrane protein OmpA-like peptidoglycan-associated protein
MKSAALSVCLALSWSVVSNAESQPKPSVQPQYTVEDVTKSFTEAPVAETAGQAPAIGSAVGPQDTCESRGKVTGPDGLCYSSNASTAGFNLGRRMSAPAVRVARPVRPAAQQIARAKLQRDLLITFKLGSAELTDQGRANAEVFAKAIKQASQLADAKFQLAGYTDASGRGDKNVELSQRRADAVKTFLVGLGVDGARLTAKGYGAQDFLPGLPPTAQENRRVVASKE